jgi:hypothetical protein
MRLRHDEMRQKGMLRAKLVHISVPSEVIELEKPFTFDISFTLEVTILDLAEKHNMLNSHCDIESIKEMMFEVLLSWNFVAKFERSISKRYWLVRARHEKKIMLLIFYNWLKTCPKTAYRSNTCDPNIKYTFLIIYIYIYHLYEVT